MDHISKWRFNATISLWFWENVLLKMSFCFLRFLLAWSLSILSLNFFLPCFYYSWADNISDYCRKDKSLGVLSQKFLMMFLVSEVKSSSHDISFVILLHEKFLQFDWLRAVVFQLNLKYRHMGSSILFVCDIWHKYHSWYLWQILLQIVLLY